MGPDNQQTEREDLMPPPVVVGVEEDHTVPAESAGEPLRAVETHAPDSANRPGFLRRHLGALLLATASTVSAAGGAVSCNPDGTTASLSGEYGDTDSAEQVNQKPQMLFVFTDENLQGFSLNLYHVGKAINFEIFNQGDGADMVKVSSSGEPLESVEGTFKTPADVGIWINAYDAETGEKIGVGKPAPEGGIEWINIQ